MSRSTPRFFLPILLVLSIVASACGDRAQNPTSTSVGKVGAATTQTLSVTPAQLAFPDRIDAAEILITLFDGKNVDPVLEQPIRSVFRLDEKGNLYEIYAPPAHNQSGDIYAVSPDGFRLAIMQDDKEHQRHDLVIVGTDGENPRQLAHSTDQITAIAWSPDGSEIAYAVVSSDHLTSQVLTVNQNGNPGPEVAQLDSEVQGLAWSPESQLIAVDTLARGGQDQGVLVIDTITQEMRRLSPSGVLARGSIWSNNGRRLAFTSQRDIQSSIFVFDSSTGTTSELHSENAPWQPRADAWLYDGETLLLTGYANPGTDKSDLWTWNTQSGTIRNLTASLEYSAQYLCMSSDEQSLLLSAMINGPSMYLDGLSLSGGAISRFAGIPYVQFGLDALYWGPLAPLPPGAIPIASGIQMVPEQGARAAATEGMNQTTVSTASIIAMEGLNLRENPSLESTVVGHLNQGERIVAVATTPSGDWVKVVIPGSKSGFAWVYAQFTNLDALGVVLPVAYPQ